MNEALQSWFEQSWFDDWNRDYYFVSDKKYKAGDHLKTTEKGVWKEYAEAFDIFTTIGACMNTCNDTGVYQIYKVVPNEMLGHVKSEHWVTSQLEIVKCVKTISVMS